MQKLVFLQGALQDLVEVRGIWEVLARTCALKPRPMIAWHGHLRCGLVRKHSGPFGFQSSRSRTSASKSTPSIDRKGTADQRSPGHPDQAAAALTGGAWCLGPCGLLGPAAKSMLGDGWICGLRGIRSVCTGLPAFAVEMWSPHTRAACLRYFLGSELHYMDVVRLKGGLGFRLPETMSRLPHYHKPHSAIRPKRIVFFKITLTCQSGTYVLSQ